jgi:hypothetical protein
LIRLVAVLVDAGSLLFPVIFASGKKQVRAGEVISEVEPILDEHVKKEIHNTLKKEELITQIDFW